MIRRDHARLLAAVLACTLAASPAGAISLYSGVKTRTTLAPLTGCCSVGTRAALPDLSESPMTPNVSTPEIPAVPQIPQLPGTSVPKAVAPVAPALEAMKPGQEASPLDQAKALSAQIEKAGDQGGDASRVSLTQTFDGGARPIADEAAGFDAGLVDAAQALYYPQLPKNARPAVAVGVAPRPQGAPVDDSELKARMELSPLTNAEREETVKKLFVKAGAQPSEIVAQPAGRGKNNYYVVKKGRTDRVIVVGAHHDKVSEGAGTIDNWTGATMMINLYQAMRDVDTDATIVFIAFAREEEGLIGSEAYVNSLTQQQKSKIDAMVNLDTLGVDGTFSWKNNSTRAMLDRILAVAKAEKRDLTEAFLDGGDADSSTFRKAMIAAMTIFGASQDVIFDIIHTPRDSMAAFSLPHYRNAYLLTLALIKELDRAPLGKPGRV